MRYELNSYAVHMNCECAILYDGDPCHEFVTKSYKFLIFFLSVKGDEILVLKGIPGFSSFKCWLLLKG